VVVVGTTPVVELVEVVGVTAVLELEEVVVGTVVGHCPSAVGFFALKSLSATFLIWLVGPKSTE